MLVLLNGVPSYQTNGKQCRNGISDDGLIFNSETCGIKFSHADWREKQIVKIMGQTDQLVNIKDRIVFLRLYNSDEVTPIQDLLYWKNIHLPDIKVIWYSAYIYIHEHLQYILIKECVKLLLKNWTYSLQFNYYSKIERFLGFDCGYFMGLFVFSSNEYSGGDKSVPTQVIMCNQCCTNNISQLDCSIDMKLNNFGNKSKSKSIILADFNYFLQSIVKKLK